MSPTLVASGIETLNGSAWHDGSSFISTELPSPYTSKTITCENPFQSATDDCGTTYTAGGYCKPAELTAKKTDRTAIQPSLFTGKMKLLVQALYGSIREDFYRESQISGASLKLEWGGIKLDPLLSADNWCLFTHTEGLNRYYFLVNVIGSSFTYIPLVFPDYALNWITLMLQEGGTRSTEDVLEAYILSTAMVDLGNMSSAGIVGMLPLFDPLFYGWQAKWEGDELSIVTQEVVDTPDDQAWQPWKHVATISFISPSTLGCTVAAAPAGEYWNPANSGTLIWIPDLVGGGHKIYDFAGTLTERYIGNYTDSTVNCWYDSVDVLVETKISKQHDLADTAAVYQPTAALADRPYLGGEPALSEWRQQAVSGSYLGSASVSVGGVTKEVTRYELGYLTQLYGVQVAPIIPTYSGWSANTAEPEFEPSNYLVANSLSPHTWAVNTGHFHYNDWYAVGNVVNPADPATSPLYQIRYAHGLWHITGQWETEGLSENGVTSLILPWGDCTSSVVGTRQQSSHGDIGEVDYTEDPAFLTYYQIYNPETSQIVATSPGVAYVHGATDSIPDTSAPVSSTTPAAQEALEVVDAVVFSAASAIPLKTSEETYGFPGGFFYINWLTGPYTRGGGAFHKSTLNEFYQLTYSNTDVINNFLGDYAVGYS
ncbi:MAG: hypothetical protein DRR06_06050 [Gammaproteobacteria bacterium]|nr:MAG: hypothetical protein DRR06_06050 [Gammaproteobacteria bacterium]